MVSTVGKTRLTTATPPPTPPSPSPVAPLRSRSQFSIDLRNASDVLVEQQVAEVRALAERFMVQTGLSIEIKPVSNYAAQPFDAGCVDAVRRAAQALGHSHMPVISGAGHDAIYAARLAPAGMVFIPCKDGISHNEIEDAQPVHITAGADVLLRVMLERAGVVV